LGGAAACGDVQGHGRPPSSAWRADAYASGGMDCAGNAATPPDPSPPHTGPGRCSSLAPETMAAACASYPGGRSPFAVGRCDMAWQVAGTRDRFYRVDTPDD